MHCDLELGIWNLFGVGDLEFEASLDVAARIRSDLGQLTELTPPHPALCGEKWHPACCFLQEH